MNLVDSSGWLEYFDNGPNADFFSTPIYDVDQLIVPTLSLYEVFKRVLQQRTETDALRAIAAMQSGHVVDLSTSLALHAAKLSSELRLPMADSVMLATAREWDATFWTQDEDFNGIEGVNYIPKKLNDH